MSVSLLERQQRFLSSLELGVGDGVHLQLLEFCGQAGVSAATNANSNAASSSLDSISSPLLTFDASALPNFTELLQTLPKSQQEPLFQLLADHLLFTLQNGWYAEANGATPQHQQESIAVLHICFMSIDACAKHLCNIDSQKRRLISATMFQSIQLMHGQ
jgi:hypothetical protein